MRTTKFTRRIVALSLAILVLFGTIPFDMVANAASTNNSETTVADAATIDGWKQYFTDASTRYAGAVWVDKSVFTAKEANEYFKNDISDKLSFGEDNFGNKNFLVALSGIASNTEIVGYSVAPTDTMLVLDISGSMKNSGYVDEMVEGTNRAIDLLLNLNKNNRVGVILYSGNQSENSAATTSTATTILPLGRYTTESYYKDESGKKTSGKYLTEDSSTVKVLGKVKTEGTDTAITGSKAVSGGTYMQNGIFFAYKQFQNATDKIIPEGNVQAGVKRTPIMVFMGDGAPTIGTTKYNNVGTSDIGKGMSYSSCKEISFLTQLTAAWTKEKVSTMYGTKMRLYTLGIGTSGSQYATDVLNPMNSNSTTTELWNGFVTTDAGRDGNVTIKYDYSNRYNYKTLKVPKDDVITSTSQRGYVDSYTATTSTDTTTQIVNAFENIAKDIEKQSKILQNQYYATLVDTDAEKDGYISFSDEIGYGMEIKNIKGIHMGQGTLVTGDMFAEYMTTNKILDQNDELTEIGRELFAGLQARFGIDATEARQLITTAISNGDIAYESDENFSNYVSWYAKEDNTYIAPYAKATKGAAPADAKYLMKSYIYLGDITHKKIETSMMYTLIRIKEDIKTGYQVVEANLPAAILPMVTYSLKLKGETLKADEIESMTCNVEEKSPAVLLYEVGIKDSITPYNVSTLAQEFRPNADGTYSFYTNRWNDSEGNPFTVPDEAPNGLFRHGLMDTTVSHFIPATENVRYYYTEDTEVYVKTQSEYVLYKGNSISEGTDYYHQFQYVVKDGTKYKVETVYNSVSANAIKHTKKVGDVWYIEKGTPKNYFSIDGHEADGSNAFVSKTENKTGTLAWSLYPKVNYDSTQGEEGYHVVGYLGNNGKVTVTAAQGIKLTKNVSEVVAGANNNFTFQITLEGNDLEDKYPIKLVKADGTESNGIVQVAARKIEVTISAGDTIYITGLSTGTNYKVTEKYHAAYVPITNNVEGTVAANSIQEVTFVNSPRGYGSLLVSKDVTHPFENVPTALANKKFHITVEFSGDSEVLATIPTPENVSKEANGKYTVELTDGTDVLFTNLPEKLTYRVSETLNETDYKGFTLKTDADKLQGTIVKDTQSIVALVNDYSPEAISPNLILNGTKFVDGGLTSDDTEYEIMLQQIVIGESTTLNVGEPISIGKVKKGQSYSYAMDSANGINYTEAGSYSYIVYELEPTNGKPENIAYDKTFALFTIIVADDNADGKLEIKDIKMHRNSASYDETSNAITKDFHNVYMAATISVNMKKTVNHQSESNFDGNILFGLYESADSEAPKAYALTDADGKAKISLNIRQNDYADTKYYYIREAAPVLADRVIGMTYDESVKYVISIVWEDSDAAPTVKYYEYDANNANGVGNEITMTDERPLVINNTYDGNVTSTPAIILSGSKTLNGRGWNESDEFWFELYVTDADFKTDGHNVEQKVAANKNSQAIRFEEVTFDSVGTKYMVIKEVRGTKGGIMYDTTVYHITVNVVKAKDENGKTILSVANEDGGSVLIHKSNEATPIESDEINFTNRYSVQDTKSVKLQGTKKLSGRKMIAGEFKFELYEIGNAVALETITNKADGTFEFATITYREAGTHTYKVKEYIPSDDNKNGVRYDTTEHTVVVTLSDNGVGGLTKTVTLNGIGVENEGNSVTLEFENEYVAKPTTLMLSGKKTLNGRTLKADEFTFRLYKANQSYEIINSDPIKTVKNSSTGDLSIELTYNDGEEGTYYYVLSEKIEQTDKKGVSYDTTEYYIRILVSDDGKGHLHSSVSRITSSGSLETVTNGNLNFNNTYSADATDVIQVTGYKKLVANDRDIKADEFEFELYEADIDFQKNGRAIATTKNKADTSFTFDKQLTFEEAGTYYYVVQEKDLGEEGMTYDDTVFGVKIVVTDNEVGKLTAEIQYLKLGDIAEPCEYIEFKNVYTPKSPTQTPTPEKPEEPKVPSASTNTGSPKTGDHTNLTLWIAVMFVCGGPLFTIAIRKKREL